MTIERIGSPDPIQPSNKTTKSAPTRVRSDGDSVAVSSEAKEKGELLRVMDMVSSAQEIRSDRVEAVKAKLNDPNYINETVIRETADKIATLFGF